MNSIRLTAGEQRDVVIINALSDEWHIEQQTGSVLRLHVVSLDAHAPADRCAEQRICIEQCGERCTSDVYGLALLRGRQQVHWSVTIRHAACEGTSRQLFKYVLYDDAVASYHGGVIIEPHAQRVSAMQTNRNIIMSPSARMTTEPQLEIYADDVKASHGATTGQLDEEVFFYMQQRGIDRVEATKLLLKAFAADVLAGLRDARECKRLEDALDGIIQ